MTIHAVVPEAMRIGPANPLPHFALPKTNHSLKKCQPATAYVHRQRS